MPSDARHGTRKQHHQAFEPLTNPLRNRRRELQTELSANVEATKLVNQIGRQQNLKRVRLNRRTNHNQVLNKGVDVLDQTVKFPRIVLGNQFGLSQIGRNDRLARSKPSSVVGQLVARIFVSNSLAK